MKIADLIKENRILLNLKSNNKDDAILEVASLLKEGQEIINFNAFLQDIFEREKLSATGIGNGVAIPHARSEAVKDFVIAIGRSQQGIEFGALDRKPVNLILLIGTPKEEIGGYLKLLARLSRLLSKEKLKQELLKANNPKQVIGIFSEIKK